MLLCVCSRSSVCLCPPAAHTQILRTAGLHRIHTVCGAALKIGQNLNRNITTKQTNKLARTFSLCRCTFEEKCLDSDWLSIPDESQDKMASYEVVKNNDQVQITVPFNYNLLFLVCLFVFKPVPFCQTDL